MSTAGNGGAAIGPRRAVGALSVAVSAGLALVFFWPNDPIPPAPVKPIKPVVEPLGTSTPPATLTAVAIQLPPPPTPVVIPAPPNPAPQRVPQVAVRDKPTVKIAPPETVTPETVSEGRTLLRLLEHGKGPSIEIAWPKPAADRVRLYRLFTQCYGMKTAVMDGREQLYVRETPRGESWTANLDRYSGFMRRPVGIMSRQETAEVNEITNRQALSDPITLRLFPRHVDAVLIGTLKRVVDERYRSAKTIHARYSLNGGRVLVSGVEVDGHDVAGQIDLSSAVNSRRTGCTL